MHVVLVSDGDGRARVPKLRASGSAAPVNRRGKQNTIMMTVGAPNPGTGARRVSRNKSTKKFTERRIPISQANMTPELKKAIARWEQFQGTKPTHVRVFEYDDGREGVEERVCFRIGTSQIILDTVEDENGNEVRIKPLEIGMVYKGEKGSPSKQGSQWVHSFTEDGGVPPINVVEVETGIMSQLGGTYEALDWMQR